DCDVAEQCDGTSAECPADAFAPSTTVCREAEGECDVAESCSGSGPSCPSDALRPAGSVCDDDNGACDPDDVCSGSSAACPERYASAGTTCRASAGPCD